MISGERVLGLIPARGGSKGIPRKNICTLGGSPLIAWTIKAASESRYLDRTVVSTEDDEIAQVALAQRAEVPFLRPTNLSGDTATAVDVALHALRAMEALGFQARMLVLLQPTSPFRSAGAIDCAIELLEQHPERPAVVGVRPVTEPPWWMKTLDARGVLQDFLPSSYGSTRRQDCPHLFIPNGAVYAIRVSALLETLSFCPRGSMALQMSPQESLDIDEQEDLDRARWMVDHASVANQCSQPHTDRTRG
jgi:CMP-N-acetylneuraminic acid synthetase